MHWKHYRLVESILLVDILLCLKDKIQFINV
nr:MAG TPA: hypothetical protein [Caudoviricetes sp.]